MKASMSMIGNKAFQSIEGMINKGRSPRAFLERVVYPEYKKAQKKRWMTEGASQGSKWPALNPKYAERKKIQFAEFPGGGRKMLIATGKLFSSVTGEDIGGGKATHFKIVTDSGITIGTNLDYAPHVAAVRPFMTFQKEWTDGLKKKYIDWVKSK